MTKTREKLASRVSHENVSVETMAKIKRFLRPNFERVISRSSSIRATEEQIVSLTEEQYDYLDVADVNDRAVVTGAAGTGKTLLALEHARRESRAGRSVLLLCYNKLLADWMQQEVRRTSIEKVECKTYHGYLHSLISRSTYAAEFESRQTGAEPSKIFSELFPLYGEFAIAELGIEFDSLIVDEAQDLISDVNLKLFSVILRGALVGGRWLMLGDFQRQAIYKSHSGLGGQKEALARIYDVGTRFAIVPLRVNCRNTRQIGEETALLSGFDSLPYRLAHVSGLAVDYRYWKSQAEETQHLEAVLSKLLSEGVDPADIIVLSPNRFENSVASRLNGRLAVEIVDIRDTNKATKQQIKFATVHAFKGMESPIIVLCGFSEVSSEEQRSLLYVGMSRARSHLVLLLSEKAKQLVPALVAKRLSEDWKH
ncbi:ATP-binding domain-containing protein [Bradyrhizobium sp. CW1]|uniref:ATP-binding domain-containing protein n=1 Tax=Bradyrhizobium sp. CW1 TaxID=2782686 RepID=UPI001FFF876D|nr:ATP-binding domain-containing protein [Bradyrhizobium sp. CW1]UPJ27798.1 ATP-binding domain-containing protein [Bradyrhizobium sp. CW1]